MLDLSIYFCADATWVSKLIWILLFPIKSLTRLFFAFFSSIYSLLVFLSSISNCCILSFLSFNWFSRSSICFRCCLGDDEGKLIFLDLFLWEVLSSIIGVLCVLFTNPLSFVVSGMDVDSMVLLSAKKKIDKKLKAKTVSDTVLKIYLTYQQSSWKHLQKSLFVRCSYV